MKTVLSSSVPVTTGRMVFTLVVLASILPGCAPSKPAVDTYLVGVTNASPAQAAEDRQWVASLFADVAAQRGLVKESPFPPNAAALYFPGPTGLNLAISALTLDERTLAISIIPVMQGRKDNVACRAVIAEADKALQQAFGPRLRKNP